MRACADDSVWAREWIFRARVPHSVESRDHILVMTVACLCFNSVCQIIDNKEMSKHMWHTYLYVNTDVRLIKLNKIIELNK